jgi:hypothetical protein
MSLRNSMLFCLLTTSLAAGCDGGLVVDGAYVGPEGERERNYLDPVRCPDPEIECDLQNGKGIYTDEGGKAFADSTYRISFNTFHNHDVAPFVTASGRYYNPWAPTWTTFPADKAEVIGATHASFPGTVWTVYRMREYQNGLLVTLTHPSLGARNVYGHDLANLVIKINFKLNTSNYLLSFHGSMTEGNVVKYVMRWKKDGSSVAPVSYCWDSGGNADLTVFQSGIEVDGLDGHVTDRATTVTDLTMSCRKGAIATCKVWGYDEIATPWHFDSCIHMKRASYCGDRKAWTQSGTAIDINDNAGINSNLTAQLEAYWSPDGAQCVNMSHLRQPFLMPSAFNGICNGVAVASCANPPVGADFLMSSLP